MAAPLLCETLPNDLKLKVESRAKQLLEWGSDPKIVAAVRAHNASLSELIEQAISKSNEGSSRLEEMGVAMGSITGATEQVRGLAARVSGASQEQAQRFQGLVRSVSEIRQGTESAAASVEQSAAAGEELSAEAIALRAIVQELSVLVDGLMQ